MFDSDIRNAISARIWRSIFLLIIPLPLSIAQSMIETDLLPAIELLQNDRISIYAERNSDLKYAERFAETVYNASYETTGEPSGKGLIIIGKNDQPHPMILVEKYAVIKGVGKEGLLSTVDFEFFISLNGKSEGTDDKSLQEEMGDDFEYVINAIPFPLPPEVLHLYLIAKEEDFDDQRIQERFQYLSPQDLKYSEFESFDWVVYLPQKSAVDKAIKKLLPIFMKKEKLGFFKRALVRGAVFTFKPLIKDVMEGIRKSLLYDGILRATSDLNDGDINALTNAYRNALMPKGKLFSGKKKEDRSLDAIQRQLKRNAEYAKDPFVLPESFIEIDPALYSRYEGTFSWTEDQTRRIYQEDSILYYKKADSKASILKPVTETLFRVGENKTTIEFLPDDEGHYTSAKVKWGRNRRTIHRKEPVSLLDSEQ